MTDKETRPYLMKAYEDLESIAFNDYLYSEKEAYEALRWVMKRGVDLRGFTMEVED